mmetsp:Transcript_68544/g.178506  ORF Transcript_68544/g.178506 Transcript_68544/m.178506 type:complete len:241 (-) Transcript_68544:148-870(-)
MPYHVTHRLHGYRLGQIQPDVHWSSARARELDLLGPEAFALQVAPETHFDVLAVRFPPHQHLGVIGLLSLLYGLQQVHRRHVYLLDLQVADRVDVVHAQVLLNSPAVLAGPAVPFHQVADYLLGLLALGHGVLHLVDPLLAHHGHVRGDLALVGHVRSGVARHELLPAYLVVQLGLLVLQVLLPLALHADHDAVLLLQPLRLEHPLLGVVLLVEADAVGIQEVLLQLQQAVLLFVALLVD